MVFLDFDGVLAPIRHWDRYGGLDPGCIRVLNEIVAGAGADVVVSSTWRHGKTIGELQEMLEAEGFIGRVIDKTPVGPPGADREMRSPPGSRSMPWAAMRSSTTTATWASCAPGSS